MPTPDPHQARGRACSATVSSRTTSIAVAAIRYRSQQLEVP
ncbi:hypothetical protein ATKI12_4212 [Kitasatospora sp. Ki12]